MSLEVTLAEALTWGMPCSIFDRETDYPDCDILWRYAVPPGECRADFLNDATTVALHSFIFIHCHPVIRVIGLCIFFWVCAVQSQIFIICEIGSCLFYFASVPGLCSVLAATSYCWLFGCGLNISFWINYPNYLK